MNYFKFQELIYQKWKSLGFYKSSLHPKKPFCITLPPPNVTGKLHLGHAWDSTIQDIIIRSKKLQGYDTLFLCGTDHAGIATQSKAEAQFLALTHKSRNEISSKEYLEFTHKWVNEVKENIYKQWINLGLLVDWDNEVFTLDNHFSKTVVKAFTQMYQDKLIVQEGKMIHLDYQLETAISDIEVIYEDAVSNLYYIKYFLDKSSDYIVIATSRPETIFADVAIVVNPNDKKYLKYHNKTVINPLTNKVIPILLSEEIETDFGTGAMKLTPGHDFHDYEINKKFNLEIKLCIEKNGKLNNLANEFCSLDRIKARELIIKKLILTNNYLKTEKYNNRIGKSQRTMTIIEPIYSVQWFIKTKSIAKKVIENQKTKNKVVFYPSRFEDTFNTWLENIDDWCISRQLWWGHPIPIMHNLKTKELKIIDQDKIDNKIWVADTNVLDTWFSSSLWPFVSLKWPDKNEKWNYYFPTNLLVTGYDIIFFWVAKMMMMSLYFINKIPFKEVYIHGLIRDSQNRKMSKSLNNGIDPNDVIKKYGADSLRHFLISNSEAGLDLRYDPSKLENQSNFLVQKIYTIYQELTKLNSNSKYYKYKKNDNFINLSKKYTFDEMDLYLLKKLKYFKYHYLKNINNYTFININYYIREFFYNTFIKHYLTYVKKIDDSNTYLKFKIELAYLSFLEFLKYLHPVMPFCTDDIFSKIINEFILENSVWENNLPDNINQNILIWYPGFIKLITIIEKNLKKIKNKNIYLQTNIKTNYISDFFKQFYDLNLVTENINCEIIIKFIAPDDKKLLNVDADKIQYLFVIDIIDNQNSISNDEILNKINKINFEIKRCENMLNSKNFLDKAPKNLIDQEKSKLLIHKKNLIDLEKMIKK